MPLLLLHDIVDENGRKIVLHRGGAVFAGTDADDLLDRLDPNLAVSNGAAILETARQRTRNEREIREQGSRERAHPG